MEIAWQFQDKDGDPCTVDLGWTDRQSSGLKMLVQDLPAQQGGFKQVVTIPTDRPVYVYGVIRDSKEAGKQVFSPAILSTAAVSQSILDYLLGKRSNAAGLDVNGDRIVNVADLLKSLQVLLPVAPAQPSPAEGATGVDVLPKLRWAASAQAKSYQLYLWSATRERPTTPTAQGLTINAFMPAAALSKGVKYCWQVVAIGDVSLTHGPVWTFTTRP